MSGWIAAIRGVAAGEPVALVTVLATEGSAPRGPGARLVVTAQGETGSIGGGALEYRAIDQARAMLARPAGSWRVQDYPLGPLLGQCCGGRVRLLVERLGEDRGWLDLAAKSGAIGALLGEDGVNRDGDAAAPLLSARGDRPAAGTRYREPADERRRPLLLLGAGHVGRAVARLLPGLPLDAGWYDSRAEMAAYPGVVPASEADLVACAGGAGPDAAVLILTHDHALDYRLVRAALGSRARFVGLIGSATKRARFLSRLAEDGVAPADRDRLVCPIGLPGIDGKAPEVIAVAAVAQLLALGPIATDTQAMERVGRP